MLRVIAVAGNRGRFYAVLYVKGIMRLVVKRAPLVCLFISFIS
jgi:hypothetical protein